MNWNIFINGIVIGDEQELREQITPLISNPSNLNAITADILEAAAGTQPSEAINQWLEREPGITACVDFVRPPAAAPQTMELRQNPLDTQLATIAATGLMSGYEDHLIMTGGDGGLLVVNNENPPTLEQAGDMVRRLFTISQAAANLDEFGKWNMGSLIFSFEETFGENFSISQFVEQTETNYNTTITCVSTYKAFRERRYRLSYTHHKEALFSKFPKLGLTDEERHTLMHRLMAISERFQLSCSEQRKLFSYANNFGIEPITEIEENIAPPDRDPDEEQNPNMILDRSQLVDRVTVRDASRNYLFRFQNRLWHWRGARGALPRGATSVVCTDDWRQISPNGEETPLPHWHQTGTEAMPADD